MMVEYSQNPAEKVRWTADCCRVQVMVLDDPPNATVENEGLNLRRPQMYIKHVITKVLVTGKAMTLRLWTWAPPLREGLWRLTILTYSEISIKHVYTHNVASELIEKNRNQHIFQLCFTRRTCAMSFLLVRQGALFWTPVTKNLRLKPT